MSSKTVHEDDNQIILVEKNGGGINIAQVIKGLHYANPNRIKKIVIDKKTLKKIHDLFIS